MENTLRRIFVEKKDEFNIESEKLLNDIRENLQIMNLIDLKVVNRYDIWNITDSAYKTAKETIFSDPTVDILYEDELNTDEDETAFAVEYLKGQYDQRADSALQCIKLISESDEAEVFTAKVYVLKGKIDKQELVRIKKYCINPVDSKEASLSKPDFISAKLSIPQTVETVSGFISINNEELINLYKELNLAMSFEDFKFLRDYFKNSELRNPTITEIRVIDTYWSDHCRHTTFNTIIDDIEISDGKYNRPIADADMEYKKSRNFVYPGVERDITLMDIATIGMKELKKLGKLDDLDASDEINACSIKVPVNVNGENQNWLVMFKNETHNHPTEIEPFGGAATCLGGAIRDPLSGRSYVYQAMRVTGSGDPRVPIEDTIEGKLPQRKITTGAALGYSSYGNQIGLATGQVDEVYDDDFAAKRMEIGAVIGAVPEENVKRSEPEPGDIVIVLGGRTGRDGCGGATGSSKEHDENSIKTCGAEVQKGNAPEERKIQRLFRNPKVSRMIKRCNDFGAGGVSVAIGEIADGLEINLDSILKKYEGLDGTELAISESQERMAVAVDMEKADEFIKLCSEENLEAVKAAKVTGSMRLKMYWRGNAIVDLDRNFLNTNGVKQHIDVRVSKVDDKSYFNSMLNGADDDDIKKAWINNLKDLNTCSKRGLSEMFDGTIGAGTVLMPYGGKYQLTPEEGMAAKIPVQNGCTNTSTIMTYGYYPQLAKWSPFHGAVYAVLSAVTKIAAMGGDYKKARLTFQEYFEKPGDDPKSWGKPYSALLGALYVQKMLEIPAIGGKDSMSGTFNDMHVPPTLVAFAVDVIDAQKVISSEFKCAKSKVVLIKTKRNEDEMPDFEQVKLELNKVYGLNENGYVLSAGTVKAGGLAETISKMCFGNKIGFSFNRKFDSRELFNPEIASIILEIKEGCDIDKALSGLNYEIIGDTAENSLIKINNTEIDIDECIEASEEPLKKVFTFEVNQGGRVKEKLYEGRNTASPVVKTAKPKVFIPVFPGTNCEYDSKKAFEKAGAEVEISVFRNIKKSYIEESAKAMAEAINRAQIIMLPGGFSAGDEPDGSGKFISNVFRNPYIKDAVTDLIENRDGLIIGICNGFQALIKLGLVPFGKIVEPSDENPTLTFNKIGRHMSKMVRTKVVSTLSPWFLNVDAGDIFTIPVSHGEGRFYADENTINALLENGQIAAQYVDFDGHPSMDIKFNPNGSLYAVEAITSPDGRILGKMGHSERKGEYVLKNVPGNKDQMIFESGVKYFR